MKRSMLAFVAAAACSAAAASTWDVRYAGMPWLPGPNGDTGPSATLDVLFSGTDLNGDQVLTADELTALHFNLLSGVNPTRSDYPVLPVVTRTPCGPYPTCSSSVSAFSFSLATRTLDALDGVGLRAYNDWLDFDGATVDIYGRVYYDATQATVTTRLLRGPAIESMAVAVPEPATTALWALGLAAVAAAGWRRRVRPASP